MITARFEETIRNSIEVKVALLSDRVFLGTLHEVAESLIQIYENGGKLLIAGNGGSAADAQHFAAEITCQYVRQRKARPALALHTDTSALTAWGNDYSFETAFARQVEANGVRGDGLIVISTSGNSADLVAAAHAAQAKGMSVFGLLGRDGGRIQRAGLCRHSLIVLSAETPRIQEAHILVIHMLCEELDRYFWSKDQEEKD